MDKKKESLVSKVKQKKELHGLGDKIVKDAIEDYLEKYKLDLNKLAKTGIKVIIKEVRSKLRDLTGRFQVSTKKRLELLQNNQIKELLKTHSSTAERLAFYPDLKKLIASLRITSILDLGCGLNPLALANKEINYHAADIKEDDLNIVKIFFKKNKIKGEVFIYDLRKISDNLPKADICLIFKVLDIIEKNPYKLTEKILLNTMSKYFLISFATRTLSGKKMNHPERRWLDYLLKRINYKYKTFNSDNEIFYLITKNELKFAQ